MRKQAEKYLQSWPLSFPKYNCIISFSTSKKIIIIKENVQDYILGQSRYFSRIMHMVAVSMSIYLQMSVSDFTGRGLEWMSVRIHLLLLKRSGISTTVWVSCMVKRLVEFLYGSVALVNSCTFNTNMVDKSTAVLYRVIRWSEVYSLETITMWALRFLWV